VSGDSTPQTNRTSVRKDRVSIRKNRWRNGISPAGLAAGAVVTAVALAIAGCGGSGHSGAAKTGGKTSTVTIKLTPQGCAPKPAKIPAGPVQFNVDNSNADAVSEAELRTGNLSSILGEQENLTPGLSGGFSLTMQPGSYKINCPGASQPHWSLTVSGQSDPGQASNPQLIAAVQGYAQYINANTAGLVQHSQAMCKAVSAGNLSQAQVLYPKARVYYERIEPVAEIWGTLDTEIDGRWENPVTVASQFMGFHKIEQLMWTRHTLKGVPALCAGLVGHEKQLATLTGKAQYNPLELASGATDLINEAATAKITGEEERYSNTDFIVFQANLQGAERVVSLLQPYLKAHDPALLSLIQRRYHSVTSLLSRYEQSPGYDQTGFVSYTKVTSSQRRQLSTAVNAFAEQLSQLSGQVSKNVSA
jgi:iron uptake system component EfeO